MRANIVGSGGSGKTMLAAAVAQTLGCPHIELDALHWGPNWSEIDLDEFRARVAAVTSADEWVADGNYGSKIRDLLWPRTTTVIWLDYPLPLILWRLSRRSLHRVITREELWNGNRESLWGQFIDKDGLIRYVIGTHKRRREQMLQAMDDVAYQNIDFVRLPSPAEAQAWLLSLG